MAEFTSQAQGNTAVTLGAIGLGLGVLNASRSNGNCGNNNGLLGGLFGSNNNNDCCVSEKEFIWAQKFASKESELAKCEAERYSDGVGISVYKDMVAYVNAQNDKQSAIIKDVTSEVIRQGQDLATLKADVRCLNSKVDYENAALDTKINTAKSSLESSMITLGNTLSCKIELEAERRQCGDEKILTYVNGNFIMADKYLNGEKVFCPDSSICKGK